MTYERLGIASRLAIPGLAFALWTFPALADEFDVGKTLFMAHCASCHGESGAGKGIMTKYLNINPSDLTALAQKNDGVFPFPKVVRVIDGRFTVRAHGQTNMPVWGYTFQRMPGAPKDARQNEEFTSGRIASLTLHVATIQK